MTYQPDFDIDNRRGKVGENLVGSFVEALANGTIEVKTDYGVQSTGNLYIETWQYRNPDESDKRPSGINTTKADFWAFASPDGTGFLCISTQALKEIIKETNPREAKQPISSATTMASIGRLVKLSDLTEKMRLTKERTK
jgi:hypothetical protein